MPLRKGCFGNDWLVVFTVVFLFFFSLLSLYGNFGLIVQYFSSSGYKLSETLLFVYGLLTSLYFISPLDFFLRLLATFLFSLNISLVFVNYKKEIGVKDKTAPAFSFFLTFLGTSCVSCGSVFLGTTATFLGLGTYLSLFPMHGREFSLLAIFLLIYSNYFLIQRITNPYLCRPAISEL